MSKVELKISLKQFTTVVSDFQVSGRTLSLSNQEKLLKKLIQKAGWENAPIDIHSDVKDVEWNFVCDAILDSSQFTGRTRGALIHSFYEAFSTDFPIEIR